MRTSQQSVKAGCRRPLARAIIAQLV